MIRTLSELVTHYETFLRTTANHNTYRNHDRQLANGVRMKLSPRLLLIAFAAE